MSGRDNFLRDVPWTRQPQIPVGVNRGNPLSSGLVGLFVFADGMRNVVKPADYSSTTFGSGVEFGKANALGRGMSASGGGGLLTTSAPALGGVYTHTAVVQISSFAGQYSGIFCASVSDGSDQQAQVQSGAGNTDILFNSGDFPGISWTGGVAVVTDNKPHVISVTRDASSRELFFDGVSKASGSAGSLGAAPQRMVFFGERTASATYCTNGTYYLHAVHNRVLSRGEISALASNPWQLFAPLPRRIFVGTTAGGAYTLTAESGTFTLSGQAATLAKNSVLSAEAGTFTLSGQAATLLKNSVLVGAAGSFALNGQDASFTYTPLGSYTLTAETGTFTLSGQDATLLKSRVLSGEFGAFTLTGQDASFNYVAGSTYTLTADYGTFSLNGQNATLLKSKVLTAEFGAFSLTGQSATLTYTGAYTPPPDEADFTLTFPGGLNQRIGASSESADTIRIGPSSASGGTQRILH